MITSDMDRWQAIRPTKVFFEDPNQEALRIPAGGIVVTKDYSPLSQRTWFFIEVFPGMFWLDTEQFTQNFERAL
jgi:hypothetical protein